MDTLLGVLEYSFIPAYGLTLLLAVIRFSKYFDTPLKYFPIIVCYTLITEMLGFFIRKYDEYDIFMNEVYTTYNIPIYNVYNIIFYLYWYYVFESYLPNDKFRTYRRGAIALFLLTAAVNPFLQNFMIGPQFYTYVVGGLVLLSYLFFYLRWQWRVSGKLFQGDDLLSWLSLGLSAFYLGYLPIKIAVHLYSLEGLRHAPTYFRPATYLLIILMYTLFCIGLIKMRRMRYGKNSG